MTLLHAVLLGLIQGVAEFLPISSSGHLAIAEHLLGQTGAAEIPDFFDVLLHLGTLAAVFAAYWQDIRDMIREFFDGIGDLARGSTPSPVPPARWMILLIIAGTLPLFAVLPVKDLVEGLGDNMYFVAGALLVTGCLLFGRRSAPPRWRTSCWWGRLRQWPPAPASPVPAPPSPPDASWALSGSLPCGFPSCCPSQPFWAPIF